MTKHPTPGWVGKHAVSLAVGACLLAGLVSQPVRSTASFITAVSDTCVNTFRGEESPPPSQPTDPTDPTVPSTTTEPPVTETEPSVTETEPPVTETKPSVTETEPPVTETKPSAATTAPSVTETEPSATAEPVDLPTGESGRTGGAAAGLLAGLGGLTAALLAGKRRHENSSYHPK